MQLVSAPGGISAHDASFHLICNHIYIYIHVLSVYERRRRMAKRRRKKCHLGQIPVAFERYLYIHIFVEAFFDPKKQR